MANQSETDATGGVIPYRNPAALAAYYTAIASLVGLFLPPIGMIIGIAALGLGMKGWSSYRADRRVGGNIHSWVGILLGGAVGLICLVVTAIIVYAFLIA